MLGTRQPADHRARIQPNRSRFDLQPLPLSGLGQITKSAAIGRSVRAQLDLIRPPVSSMPPGLLDGMNLDHDFVWRIVGVEQDPHGDEITFGNLDLSRRRDAVEMVLNDGVGWRHRSPSAGARPAAARWNHPKGDGHR